jgi:hypothetical protein
MHMQIFQVQENSGRVVVLNGPEGILFIPSNVQIPGVQIENMPPMSACDPNAYWSDVPKPD